MFNRLFIQQNYIFIVENNANGTFFKRKLFLKIHRVYLYAINVRNIITVKRWICESELKRLRISLSLSVSLTEYRALAFRFRSIAPIAENLNVKFTTSQRVYDRIK